MYTRILTEHIQSQLFTGKILLLYGARQVGKTTLVKSIADQSGVAYAYYNADEGDVRQAMSSESSQSLRRFLGSYPLIIIDEAQRVENIGLKLKLLHDTFPDQQIIVTGSSSLDLANKINEPLTGRIVSFMLYPLSFHEIKSDYDILLPQDQLQQILRFGSYPDIIGRDNTASMRYLKELSDNYLYKDILQFEHIQKSSHIQKLVQLLAYQIGQEVSLNELANKLNLHVSTVDRYIGLLEDMFIIFRLRARSNNLRNEISKKEKIYFRDCGVRNAVINAYEDMDIRQDIGQLRENFCIIESIKYLYYSGHFVQHYFWRNYQGQEVDYMYTENSKIFAFECKWNSKKKVKVPPQFQLLYPHATFDIIHPQNYDTLFR